MWIVETINSGKEINSVQRLVATFPLYYLFHKLRMKICIVVNRTPKPNGKNNNLLLTTKLWLLSIATIMVGFVKRKI